MSKRKAIIALIVLAIVGSVVGFYASNLFFGDIANVAVGLSRSTILATFPALMLGAMIVTACLYIVRLYKRPKTIKRLSTVYSFIMIGLAFVGLLTAILAGVLVYGSFTKPHPFPGYLIIAIVLHALVLGAMFYGLFKCIRPMPEDEEKFKVTVGHVFHTLGLFLLISLAFNRFGALLFLPIYVEPSTLGMTFVLYLFLLVPMALLIYKVLDIFELNKKLFIYVVALAGVTLVLMVATIILGRSDTAFISSVSPVMPLERLASMPVELIIHCLTYVGVLAYYLVREIKKLKAEKKAAPEEIEE